MAKGYFKKSKYTLIMFLAPPRKSSFGVAPIVFMLKNLYKSNGQLEKAKRQKKIKMIAALVHLQSQIWLNTPRLNFFEGPSIGNTFFHIKIFTIVPQCLL